MPLLGWYTRISIVGRTLLTHMPIDWALPDQLVYAIVSALLTLSNSYPDYRGEVTIAICNFLAGIARGIESSSRKSCDPLPWGYGSSYSTPSAVDILTHLAPALHGLYRAISSTPFPWSLSQWQQITQCLNELRGPSIVDKLNHIPTGILRDEDAHSDDLQFIQTFISRYISNGRPLSGFFVVCCVIEMQWTILAQALAPPRSTDLKKVSEAAAANRAWSTLMHDAALQIDVTQADATEALRATIAYAMQCFADLLVQIEEMEAEPSMDTYAWETMSESIVGTRIWLSFFWGADGM